MVSDEAQEKKQKQDECRRVPQRKTIIYPKKYYQRPFQGASFGHIIYFTIKAISLGRFVIGVGTTFVNPGFLHS